MAKKIQGITIDVNGDTSKLQKSLNQLQAPINKINTELKNVEQALKFDPKNTELLAQKQEVLSRNIAATRDKLQQLKKAQEEMGSYASLTDKQKENYNKLSAEISKTENYLVKMNKELKETSKVDLTKVKDGLKKVGEAAAEVSKKMLEVSSAVAGILASVVGLGVKSYAELEKASKGAERLFGDAYETVKKNAAEAYKSMGLSSTQYYDQVNQYAVGLKEALGGDSQAAANLANDILVAQADIVAATGASTDAVQNAFSAVMRGNYTLIDNLRLGIKGSKEGMQEAIDKVNEWNAANGNATNYTMNSYADMEKALVDYVKMTGIAGTAQKQMSSTITGSIAQMKAAFDNFLNGSGSPEALSETIVNTLTNIGKAIKELAPSILSGIVDLVKDLLPKVVSMLFELLPELLDAISELIDELLNLLTENTDSLQTTITTLINKVVEFITTNLPKILEIAIQLVITLAQGIAESLPELIPAVIECLITMVNTLLENIGLIIDAGIELIMALVDALTEDSTLDMIIDAVPTILEALINALIENGPKLLTVGPKLIIKLIEGIIKSLVKLVEKGPEIITALIKGIIGSLGMFIQTGLDIINSIKDSLGDLPSKAVQWGKDMIQGIIDGITGMLGDVGTVAKKVANKIASFLHFSKPDEGPLREYETWMPDFVNGLAKSLKSSSGILENATLELADDMSSSLLTNTSRALRGLNAGVSASLNPTINPTYSYDLNYQLMASALKEALKEVEVDLDDRQVGKFIEKTVSEEVYS